MTTANAVKVSLEEMRLNEPRRKRISGTVCDIPYTFVFGRKLYINKADIHIFINNKFQIYYEK